MADTTWDIATAVLRLASDLVDGVQQGMAERGFGDVRPAHGFAFARLSAGPATNAQLAQHLGVTKQAASELVAHLIDRGYLRREPSPRDRRAALLVLTERGEACTRAAEEAAVRTVDGWAERLPAEQFDVMSSAVQSLALPGRLRPSW